MTNGRLNTWLASPSILFTICVKRIQRLHDPAPKTRWGATNTSGRESTQGLSALGQKYHLLSKCEVN